jgi:hypothetical protein
MRFLRPGANELRRINMYGSTNALDTRSTNDSPCTLYAMNTRRLHLHSLIDGRSVGSSTSFRIAAGQECEVSDTECIADMEFPAHLNTHAIHSWQSGYEWSQLVTLLFPHRY